MHMGKKSESKCKDTVCSVPSSISKYLEAKLVVEEVDEVLDAGQNAMIQVLPRDALEDDAEGRNLQVVVEAVVELVPVDSGLKHQQPQHHQVVLKHTLVSVVLLLEQLQLTIETS